MEVDLTFIYTIFNQNRASFSVDTLDMNNIRSHLAHVKCIDKIVPHGQRRAIDSKG
jgi:hypothetical protein